MPTYDFACRVCGERFEAMVPSTELPPCPACAAPETERLLSAFAGPFKVGLRGAAARRSNAARSVREEQRREQREERRRAREQGKPT